MSARVEVRPGLTGKWTAWTPTGDMAFSGDMLNALAMGIARAREARCELWVFEGEPYDKGEQGLRVADFGVAP